MRTVLIGILVTLCCTGSRAAAQTVRGTLVQEGSGVVVPATLVVLLNAEGRQVGGALTDDAGLFLLRAPGPGRYRVRVERIGYQTTLSAPIDLGVDEIVERRIAASVVPTRIEGLVVEARSRCAMRPDVGRNTAALWEEARKALEAASFTERAGFHRFRVRRFERDLDPETLRISGEKEEVGTVFNNRPFVARPAEYLLDRGFVERDREGTTYYAPDADVLLSDTFLEGYCFQIVSGEAGSIGLSFRPVSGRGPPAVTGTLWFDRETLELRSLEYGYTRLPLLEEGDQRIGGRLEFEALPSGAWIVRRWWIRMPLSIAFIGSPSPLPLPLGSARPGIVSSARGRVAVTAFREEGGEVLEILDGGQSLRPLARGSVSGVVYDSAGPTPLPGATVYLSGTGYSATSDAEGRFRIEGLPEGEYSLSFMHPRLSAFGIYPALQPIDVRAAEESLVRLEVAPNARADAVAARCAALPRPADERDTGVLVGQVRGGATGGPVGGAEVQFAWARFETQRVYRGEDLRELTTSVVVRTAPDGGYMACGLAKNRPITARIVADGQVVHQADLEELGEAAYVERDFLTPPPTGAVQR